MKYRRALAILALLAVGAWLFSRPSAKDSIKAEKAGPPTRSARASVDEPGNSGRHVEPTGGEPQDHSFTRHEASQLKDFILPRLEGRKVSLHEALRILHEAYLDACFRSQEKPLALKFSVKDEPGHPISFSLRGQSLLTCLNHLAALAGLGVDRKELSFELARRETADQPRDIVFRDEALLQKSLRALAGGEPDETTDWESLLRAAGLIREPGTRLISSDGFLKISGTQAEIARVQSGIAIASEPPVQIRLLTKLITTTSPLGFSRATLTDGELQFLTRDLAQQPGTQISFFPSLVAKESEPTTMQVTRETHRNGQPDWTGTTSRYQAERTGLKISLRDHVEYRPEETREPGWLTEIDSAVYPGDTHLQLMSSRDGVHHYRFATATAIDASGHPLNPERITPPPNEAP